MKKTSKYILLCGCILGMLCIGYAMVTSRLIPYSGSMRLGGKGGEIQVTKKPYALYVLVASTEMPLKTEIETIEVEIETSKETFRVKLPKLGQVETNWVKTPQIKTSFIFAQIDYDRSDIDANAENVILVQPNEKIRIRLNTVQNGPSNKYSMWISWASFGLASAEPIKILDHYEK